MSQTLIEVGLNLLAAWAAGSVIGLERTYNGRVAGFRTHGLVGVAAAAVMTIAYAPALAPGAFPGGAERLDPTRLAQGIMTGVGFLGAGVIFKEGVSIQGLTTAASVWATAAIGLLCGLGLEAPGFAAAAIVLLILTVMRTVEGWAPSRVYALATFRFRADQAPSERDLLILLGGHAVSLADTSYKLADEGRIFEFRASLETKRGVAFESLAQRLRTVPGIVEFELDRVSK